MQHVSHIEEFDVSNPAGWEEYAERLEFHFAANGIRDARKKLAVLCSVCGQKTYSVIRSLTAPQSPASMSFAEKFTAVFNTNAVSNYRAKELQIMSQSCVGLPNIVILGYIGVEVKRSIGLRSARRDASEATFEHQGPYARYRYRSGRVGRSSSRAGHGNASTDGE
uniref:Uncharacterized protein n=1 Tax=Trichuris muris TaxID=70415 RepID=A0A5S6QAX5_TRIMR